jgi:hypothetical protein
MPDRNSPQRTGLVVKLEVEHVGCLVVSALVAVQLILRCPTLDGVVVKSFGDVVERPVYVLGVGFAV